MPVIGVDPLAFRHAFPRSYVGLTRIGEVAGRNLSPCLPQVGVVSGAGCVLFLNPGVWRPQCHPRSGRLKLLRELTVHDAPPDRPCRWRPCFQPTDAD